MTAPARFRFIRRFLAPRWLTDDEGALVGYSLDLIKDAFVERLRLGLMARLPQNDPTGQTTAPPDALTEMGRDRRVVQGFQESNAGYAVRLKAWLDDRKTAGNPFAMARKIAEYTGGTPVVRTVDVRGNWFTRAADGVLSYVLKKANWNWDGDLSGVRWSRFWSIIYPTGAWSEGLTWGTANAKWGQVSQGWGSTATPEQAATVRFLVNDWKPGGTRHINTIIAFDPASFNPTSIPAEPDGTWTRWSKIVNGVLVESRLSTGRYWDGTQP